MFGRSGQMFPRRTFHDAIYEEEYGSDNEDECCRCRGLSAILCWFLSVIILVGLAATVVLTVFFILRSRTLMVKPDVDVDVELYGKDQNLYESKGVGGSKELLGSNEVTTTSSTPKRKKSNTKGTGRGPPDATKNDVDADVNEEQNAISDQEDEEDIVEDASVNHPRNHHPNHHTHNNQQHNRNRLQPYSPIKTTTTTSTTTTTTEAPQAELSEEENNQNESSSEEEADTEQSNGEGSSLFNLFSGPRNPSYSTPSQNDDEEEEEEDTEDDGNNEDEEDELAANTGGASAEFGLKNTRFSDTPVQQVLFTESPKLTVTTPSPYGGRRNLQTTRISTGRTSFTTSTTTAMPPSEETEEEEEKGENNEDDVEQQADENENDEDGGDNEENEKSSEEKQEEVPVVRGPTQTTTSVYDDGSSGKASGGVGSGESGESQLKQMLLDSIPPHGAHKDDDEESVAKEEEGGESTGDDEMGGMSSSSEFNLSQKVQTTTAEPSTTTVKLVKTTKPTKQRGSGDTLSRLISRNFTRKTTSTTTEMSGTSNESETQTDKPSTATTIGPAGHKYDYTMTPSHRTKLKTKSTESVEQEVTSTTKPPPKFTLKQRFRSTTVKPAVPVTPEPPSTAAPRTRGTLPPATSTEFGIKLGGKRSSLESPIDIVPSPDLSPKGQLKQQIERLKEQQQKKHKQPNSFEGVDLNSASSEEQTKTTSEQQFLDVLVGAEDTKTLITKKTEDGIVTSAILPPWYDSNGANSSIADVLATNGTTLSNAVAKEPADADEDVANNSGENSFGEKTIVKKKSSEEKPALLPSKEDQQGPSEFERLVNMFSKQEASSEEIPSPPPSNRFAYKKQKPIVLKKPGGSMNSRYIPQVPGRASLFPSASSSETKSTENKSSDGGDSPSPSPASPEAEATTTNLERPPGDVGRTGVLPTAADVEAAVANAGYYPETGGDSDKAVEQHMVESERLTSDETMDSTEDEEVQGNPSHVIDVNIEEPGQNPEIVIEQDSSAPLEDDDGDFVEDEDYEGYGENPPTLAMSGSTTNQNIVPPPEDYVLRGSGIRRPMSSEETDDLQQSASAPAENNATATATETPKVVSTLTTVAAIRRPAYTREEIAKAVVKPSSDSLAENNLNDDHEHHEIPTGGSLEEEFEDEYEDDDNYDGGSIEAGGASLEAWSSEKIGVNGQKWSAPDKVMDAVSDQEVVGSLIPRPRPSLSEELTEPDEMTESAESIAHPTVEQGPTMNNIDKLGDEVDNSTGVFRPPELVRFHENKLSFSPPTHADGEYHSKDGWRPVITNSGTTGGSQEPASLASAQTGSFEPEEEHEHEHHEEPEQQQLFQESAPQPQHQLFQESAPQPQHQLFEESAPQPQQQIASVPPSPQIKAPPQQQWAQEQPQQPWPQEPLTPKQQLIRQQPKPPQQPWAQEQPTPQQQLIRQQPQQSIKHNSIIPPPVPATVKFPDSEEDHEDRRHHSRRRMRPGQQGQFDRAKFMNRPAPPPIVMRRRPPPPAHNTRQGPPPPHQRQPPPPQMMQPAASKQKPQYAEPPPQSPPGRPHHPPINRNFHVRPNPMRRFNFGGGGGPPLAQPRSGGNIKWPTDNGEVSRGDSNNSNSQQQNTEGAQSEVSINKKRRRRRRAVLAA